MPGDWVAWLGGDGWLGAGEIAIRLGAAIGLSCLIGLDRELKDKPLGLRTNIMVALGSASFCVLMIELLHMTEPGPHARPIDAGRVFEGIIGGIGFLGAGAIIQNRDRVVGATTGATIWVVGAIGMACGFGFYLHALAVTLLALFVLTVLGFLEGIGQRQRSRQRADQSGAGRRPPSAPDRR
jgi:putative Mg2+ transporter-C (MgtC) family protein